MHPNQSKPFSCIETTTINVKDLASPPEGGQRGGVRRSKPGSDVLSLSSIGNRLSLRRRTRHGTTEEVRLGMSAGPDLTAGESIRD